MTIAHSPGEGKLMYITLCIYGVHEMGYYLMVDYDNLRYIL